MVGKIMDWILFAIGWMFFVVLTTMLVYFIWTHTSGGTNTINENNKYVQKLTNEVGVAKKEIENSIVGILDNYILLWEESFFDHKHPNPSPAEQILLPHRHDGIYGKVKE